MKKVFLFATFLLLLCNQNYSQGNSPHFLKHKSSKSLDSLPHIKIDRIIYYQTPIETHFGKLTSEQYEPDWFNAYSANENIDKFKDNPTEILKYIHSSINMSDSDIVNVVKYHKPKPKPMPYSYFFGEVGLTHKATGEKIIIVFEKNNDTKLPEFTMNLPSEKNKPIEKLDSIRMQAIGWNLYLEQNGVIKLPNIRYVDSLLTNNSEFFINSNLDNFKDMLYRSKSYKVTNRDNGIRKFSTMEKKANGFVKKEETYKP